MSMARNNPYSTSRAEKILQSKIDGSEYSGEPLTRMEKLLMQIGTGGGGGGSTTDSDMTDADVDDVMSVISTNND